MSLVDAPTMLGTSMEGILTICRSNQAATPIIVAAAGNTISNQQFGYPAQLNGAVLTAQPEQLGLVVAGGARPGAGVDLCTLDPAADRFGVHVDQRTDLPAGLDRGLLRMRRSALPEHPHRPVAGLLVVLAGCRHGTILLGSSEPPPEPGHLMDPHRPHHASLAQRAL